jgi:glycerol-3-phosphate cytidylyltransferase
MKNFDSGCVDMELINENHLRPYHTGLLMGVFDLFHIGHLNLIQRAKAQCDFLRIGVLSDKVVHEFKQIYPIIPQEERMEILRALRDVDEVVLLETKEEVSRLIEWKKRPFDCFFSGDDYVDNAYWAWEKEELKKLGADMVFFPYTKKRSSSMIRRELQEKGNNERK